MDQTGTQTGPVSIQETRLFSQWMSELPFHSSCPLDKMLRLEKKKTLPPFLIQSVFYMYSELPYITKVSQHIESQACIQAAGFKKL